MNEYVGKVCPFCKTAFKETDEIVVCSHCDMPHHKDCWIENQGCTTFGCMGSAKTPDGTPTTVTSSEISYDEPQANAAAAVYCASCGSPNLSTSSFCSNCGNPLQAAPVYSGINSAHNMSAPYAYAPREYYQVQAGYGGRAYSNGGCGTVGPDADLYSILGTEPEYYISSFYKMKAQNKKTSWNWCAFLVAPYWFIYRKMYGYGAAVLGAEFIQSIIGGVFTSLLSLAGYIILGIFANYIYMRQVDRNVTQLKNLTEPYRTEFIARNGGTNSAATVLTIVGYVILVIMINAG